MFLFFESVCRFPYNKRIALRDIPPPILQYCISIYCLKNRERIYVSDISLNFPKGTWAKQEEVESAFEMRKHLLDPYLRVGQCVGSVFYI